MKAFSLSFGSALVLAALALCSLAFAANAQTTPSSSVPAGPGVAHTNVHIGLITENPDKALPTPVTVGSGTIIMFMRPVAVGSDVEVKASVSGNGSLVQVQSVTVNTPPGYQFVSAYRVVGNGTVKFDVYHTYVIPGATPQLTGTMDVNVQ